MCSNNVMIQPPFFIFHPLPKSLPLRHPYKPLSQHMHTKHQFDASPLQAFPYHPRHRLWIYAHPVHLVPPSLTSCPSQTVTIHQLIFPFPPPLDHPVHSPQYHSLSL